MIKANHTVKIGSGKTIMVKGYLVGNGLFLHRSLEYGGNEQTKMDYWTITHVNSGMSVVKFESWPVQRKTILEHIGILTAIDWDCQVAHISQNHQMYFDARLSFTNKVKEATND
jgi:hypothetical protein